MRARAEGRGRIVLLALVSALAAVGAVVWSERGGTGSNRLPAPAGDYRSARVSTITYAPGRSSCGVRVGPASEGIRHPALPCGVEVYVEHGGTVVLTQVLDTGPTGADAFQVTKALAALLGLHGTATVRWRFAR